ncbi:MAG: 4Fe-4S binding protein [Armatimonadota bacterium]
MAIDVKKEPAWHELPVGGLIKEAGCSAKYKTGDWRTMRPIWDESKCINCLICWVYCPDSAVQVKEGKVTGIDLDHCKGCGICSQECPPKANAYTMVPESEFRK